MGTGMRLLQRVVEDPHECAYLPVERSSLDIRIMMDVTALETESLLERGWRRFGPIYFRPVCGACSACVSLRVDAARFAPTKSQRRVARNVVRLRRVVGMPQVDDERIDLYSKWHVNREAMRGWPPNSQDRNRYTLEFAYPHPCAREAAFYDDAAGGRLVGLGSFDETPGALSAAFFFHDPEYARFSLGTANILGLLGDARRLGKQYVYLGFRVAACQSLTYKGAFGPHELMTGRPGFDEVPVWRPNEDAAGP
jgi:arginine-tRNA-protein transferase